VHLGACLDAVTPERCKYPWDATCATRGFRDILHHVAIPKTVQALLHRRERQVEKARPSKHRKTTPTASAHQTLQLRDDQGHPRSSGGPGESRPSAVAHLESDRPALGRVVLVQPSHQDAARWRDLITPRGHCLNEATHPQCRCSRSADRAVDFGTTASSAVAVHEVTIELRQTVSFRSQAFCFA
jgi:hypothetical protein